MCYNEKHAETLKAHLKSLLVSAIKDSKNTRFYKSAIELSAIPESIKKSKKTSSKKQKLKKDETGEECPEEVGVVGRARAGSVRCPVRQLQLAGLRNSQFTH